MLITHNSLLARLCRWIKNKQTIDFEDYELSSNDNRELAYAHMISERFPL